MNMKKIKRVKTSETSEKQLIDMIREVDKIDLNFNDMKTLKYYRKSFKNYKKNNLPYFS